jgi:hypothetical protein
MVFHVSQLSELPAVLAKLHLEPEIVHTPNQVIIDNAPLPEVMYIAIGPANEISIRGNKKKTLSKCCIDPLRPPVISECGICA